MIHAGVVTRANRRSMLVQQASQQALEALEGVQPRPALLHGREGHQEQERLVPGAALALPVHAERVDGLEEAVHGERVHASRMATPWAILVPVRSTGNVDHHTRRATA